MKFLNNLISRIKGENFVLDEKIPLNYLLGLVSGRTFMLIYGICKLRRLERIFIHRTSRIKCPSKIVTIGNLTVDRGCYIDALSIDGIKFGNNVGLGTHGFFGCAGGIIIGDDTIFGNYVSLHSENHNFAEHDVPIRLQGVNRKGIRIGCNCWIGAKATILDGAEIGDGCIVAAGAVVRGKFPSNSIIGGVPAKIIKSR